VNEAFEAGFNLNECAEVGEARYCTGDALAGNKAFGSLVPGLGLELLEA
jgi:hypothetical protein